MEETVYLQPLLKDFFNSNMKGLNFCCPARIEGDQNVSQGRVDVRPLQMPRYGDMSIQELPVIKNVPLVTPSFQDSGMVMCPKQGDTVLLVFSQCSLDEFKTGSTDPYEPFLNRFMNINDAVAISGLMPFNLSPLQTERHFYDYEVGDVSSFNNLGKAKENKINIKKNGTNKHVASLHDIQGDVKTDKTLEVGVSVTTRNVYVDDIIIGGKSLLQFMTLHQHNDSQQKPTSPPLPLP